MKGRMITYGDLGNVLIQLGFAPGYTTGSHQLFEHTPSDTVILLPPSQPNIAVDGIHIIAVRKTVVERDVVDADVFDKALEDIESTVLAKS